MGKFKLNKYYVVWVGRKVGVFDSWDEARANVDGYSGAMFESFASRSVAMHEFKKGCPSPESSSAGDEREESKPDFECITVSGSYCDEAEAITYQCVMNLTGEQIFESRPLRGGTKHVADFLALVGAIKYRSAHKLYDTPIYTDSNTALVWLRNERVNSKINLASCDPLIAERISSALSFLHRNRYGHKHIRRWNTVSWGQIPADQNEIT